MTADLGVYQSLFKHCVTKFGLCYRCATQHDGHEQPLHAAWHDTNWQPDAHEFTHGHAKEHASNEYVRYHVAYLYGDT